MKNLCSPQCNEISVNCAIVHYKCRKILIKTCASVLYMLIFLVILVHRGCTKSNCTGQNMAISKKSTIVVQSFWNLVKIFMLLILRMSAWLDQNCGFFINSHILGQLQIWLLTLYISRVNDFIQKKISPDTQNLCQSQIF